MSKKIAKSALIHYNHSIYLFSMSRAKPSVARPAGTETEINFWEHKKNAYAAQEKWVASLARSL
jgi:hypothetical protein